MKETLYSWKKGIKRDILAFPVLKYDEQGLTFRDEFEAQASTQGVEEVLDEHYVPNNSDKDAKEVFKAKNEFVYSVLLRAIQTPVGRGVVRKHGRDKDAQKA